MKTKGAFLALIAVAIPAWSADYHLELKPDKTKVQFVLTDPLHTVHGTFGLKHGEIDFNPDTGKASGQVVVDVTSGESGSEARDSRMHANVLESKKFPEATFVPDHVDGALSLTGTSNVKVHGMFTVHGAAHEMTMDVQTSVDPGQSGPALIHATMGFDIPYVAWGMKDPSNFLLHVGKSVHMTIDTASPLEKR